MEIILNARDARVSILKRKSAIILAALVSANAVEELQVFQTQFDWAALENNLTARSCQTIARSLAVWYQDFVS